MTADAQTFGPCETCETPLRFIGGLGTFCCECKAFRTTFAARWGTDAKAVERAAVERRRWEKVPPRRPARRPRGFRIVFPDEAKT